MCLLPLLTISKYVPFVNAPHFRRQLNCKLFAKVLLRGGDNEAYGVEYLRHGVKKIAYASKEVILSAGTIHSPQILMLSGIGPGNHLKSLDVKAIEFINVKFV